MGGWEAKRAREGKQEGWVCGREVQRERDDGWWWWEGGRPGKESERSQSRGRVMLRHWKGRGGRKLSPNLGAARRDRGKSTRARQRRVNDNQVA